MKLFPKDIIESLEFDDVRKWISAKTAGSKARELLLHLQPKIDEQAILMDLTLVNEMLSIYQSDRSFPVLSAANIDEAIVLLRIKNATLQAEQFMEIKDLVESYNNLYRFTMQHTELLPSVSRMYVPFPPNYEVPHDIDSVFERNGEVKTSASPELSRIRQMLARKRASADRIFYKAVRKYEDLGFLGDTRETVHDNKRVMSIQAAYKGRVNGIFHGSSSKNSLLFIEPGECIEINNEVALLIDEEAREIKRILRELTQKVALHREVLIAFSEIIVQTDFHHAKARWAFEEHCCLPNINNEGIIYIKDGINPVLRRVNRSKGKGVVPLDVELNPDQRILVISGPNAGGKSITLKTMGLFQIMLQSGILLPVHPKSSLCFRERLMADIGDAQSIENELSTYSSKLQRMKVFLKKANNKSLILMDEFGSGSDPDLGSSLAQVFLEALNKRKSYGVVTTHYNSIKALVSNMRGAINGSMQFNLNTFEPAYVLQIGEPGSSYTFEVAQRSGIPPYMIREARRRLDEKTSSIDKLLVGIQKRKTELEDDRKSLHEQLAELNRLKEEHQQRIAKLEDKLQKLSARNEDDSVKLMWGKRFESLVNAWLKDSTAKNKKIIIERFLRMLGERSGAVQNEEKQTLKKGEKKRLAKLQELLSEPVKVGDHVKLLNSRQTGQILEEKKGKYIVRFGNNISTTLERDKFILADRSMPR